VFWLWGTKDNLRVEAFSLAGEPLWHADLGPFASEHGFGGSAAVWRHLLLVPMENDGPSAVVALDVKTGREAWRLPRETARAAYSTPLVVERPFGAGLVVAVLTTAAPAWNNWARGNPSWVVVMLELESHLAAARRRAESLAVGEPVEVALDPGIDTHEVDFLVPPQGALVHQTAVAGDSGALTARQPTVAAGASADLSHFVPKMTLVYLIGGIALGAVGAFLFVPKLRNWLDTAVRPKINEVGGDLVELVREPKRFALIVLGCATTTLGMAFTLWCSIMAFGGGTNFVTVTVVTMVGGTLASAAPTPGGVGAVEAALIGGLAAFGVPTAVAVPSVLLYRVLTVWLPVFAGWPIMRWLTNRDMI
jgi:hypothetical protein